MRRDHPVGADRQQPDGCAADEADARPSDRDAGQLDDVHQRQCRVERAAGAVDLQVDRIVSRTRRASSAPSPPGRRPGRRGGRRRRRPAVRTSSPASSRPTPSSSPPSPSRQSSCQSTAAAYRCSVDNRISPVPVSSLATADCDVPIRAATSVCERPSDRRRATSSSPRARRRADISRKPGNTDSWRRSLTTPGYPPPAPISRMCDIVGEIPQTRCQRAERRRGGHRVPDPHRARGVVPRRAGLRPLLAAPA